MSELNDILKKELNALVAPFAISDSSRVSLYAERVEQAIEAHYTKRFERTLGDYRDTENRFVLVKDVRDRWNNV